MKKALTDLSAEDVRAVLDYDPEIGVFTWRPREGGSRLANTWNTRYAGKAAGSRRADGYIKIRVFGCGYFAHRLAWLYMTGEWPVSPIDHRNVVKGDNRFSNLREATDGQNQANTPTRSHNKSGLKGVHRTGRSWSASIRSSNRPHYLGTFSTPEAAHAAYCNAATVLHGEFARFS